MIVHAALSSFTLEQENAAYFKCNVRFSDFADFVPKIRKINQLLCLC